MEENNKVKQVDEDIEYNQMIKTIDNLSDKIEELQDRIDKTLEYIEKTMRVDSEYPDYMFFEICEYQTLLSKLKGKDNEK